MGITKAIINKAYNTYIHFGVQFVLRLANLNAKNNKAIRIKNGRNEIKFTEPEAPTVWLISVKEYPKKSAPSGTDDTLKY